MPAQKQNDEAKSTKCGSNADLSRNIACRLRCLQGLRSKDISYSEGDKGHGIGCYLFGEPGDVPRDQNISD